MAEFTAAKKRPGRNGSGITAITVEGFKSISKRQRIEIRPLTILAGANSSGKSSVIQPLLLLKQTLEASYDPGALKLDGPNVKFTSTDQFLSKISKTDKFTVGIELGKRAGLESTFKKKGKNGIDIIETTYLINGKRITLKKGMKKKEILEEIEGKMGKEYLDNVSWKDSNIQISEQRFFLSIVIDGSEMRYKLPYQSEEGWDWRLISRVDFHLRSLIHLPGLRGNPKRLYPTAAVGEKFPGIFPEYVASIILDWQERKDKRFLELAANLEKLGLTWKVSAKKPDAASIELKVGRLSHARRGGARDLVNIADVGIGVSQTLPILVALLVAKRGQMVYLEQPEIHLHPRAQFKLAEILADAAKRGVKVVVETHSSILLRGIQTLVAEGTLPKDIVKFHWFTRDEKGSTEIASAELDEHGAFGDWPEDFGDVELEVRSRYIDAALK